jgi:hypothetical protein
MRFKPADSGFTILNLRGPECMLQEAIIDRRHGVALPEPLEIVGVDTIACLITMLKTTAMDKDYQRFTLAIGRNIKVQLLFWPSTRDVRNIDKPGNTLGAGWVGGLGRCSHLCVCGRD